MDERYERYCFVDPLYYDLPHSVQATDPTYQRLVELSAGWTSELDDRWTHCHPPSMKLPTQGWKIHVSATLDNADELLRTVSKYCVRHGLPFKFLSEPSLMFMQNSKYAARESSGKFITVYPRDVDQLRETLLRLDERVGGWLGPYVLSDLRWREGPLYIRYGAFARRQTRNAWGALVPAIETPDGRLIPDRREPRFVVPDWVSVPGFIADAARRRTTAVAPGAFPYEVLRSIHFSNGGGVYVGRRLSDGTEFILKEARPHAGLDANRDDAVTRLRREYAALAALRGIAGVPNAHEHMTFGGHDFLVMEQIHGTPLSAWIAQNYPFISRGTSSAVTATFGRMVRSILEQVGRVLTEIHSRGYVHRDLHAKNILIGADLTVSLIDFELSVPVVDAGRPPLGVPGFTPPVSVRGFDIDLYALACLALHLYAPLTSVLPLCPGKVYGLLDFARTRFAVDRTVAESIIGRLGKAGGGSGRLSIPAPELVFGSASGPWDRHMSAMIESIKGSATAERQDRLFPGDIEQFTRGGAGIAFGAAGVIGALHAAGCDDLDAYVDWLLRHVREPGKARCGLYDGLAGVSHVLYELGHRSDARRLFDTCLEELSPATGTKLFDGLSGIGLTSLSMYRRTNDSSYLGYATGAAEAVAAAIEAGAFVPHVGASPPGLPGRGNAIENFSGGLLYGWAGLALFMVRMYEITGAHHWLRAAVRAVERDLDQCQETADGTLKVANERRLLPYLATGSVGIALVCDLVLQHTPSQRLSDAVPALCRAGTADVCVGSGLFNGRAGLVYAIIRLRRRLDWLDLEACVDAGIRALDLHAIADGRGLVFPGEQNLRLSMDLATGSAGVLALLNVLSGRTTQLLPFLGAERWHPPSTDDRRILRPGSYDPPRGGRATGLSRDPSTATAIASRSVDPSGAR